MHSDTTMAEEPAAARGAVAIIANRRGDLLHPGAAPHRGRRTGACSGSWTPSPPAPPS
ncbi:hypothetical protein ACFYP4_16445 [Streptomyces sp. NPDC005551]|uniref:hypothetical protein n=1 Tax=unclassified Streptomyces TaxID=2593676 RepID=UPI0033F2CE73